MHKFGLMNEDAGEMLGIMMLLGLIIALFPIAAAVGEIVIIMQVWDIVNDPERAETWSAEIRPYAIATVVNIALCVVWFKVMI